MNLAQKIVSSVLATIFVKSVKNAITLIFIKIYASLATKAVRNALDHHLFSVLYATINRIHYKENAPRINVKLSNI